MIDSGPVKYPAEVYSPEPVPAPVPANRRLWLKLIGALLAGAIGAGASVLSCVGQSFSLLQARALESIAHTLHDHGCK